MIIKTTFKSHFKIKKNFKKNLNKFIFVKNIVIFFLFFKVFLSNCKISLMFARKKNRQIDLLKAPSRHKKFFHQVCFEQFILKSFFYFKLSNIIEYNNTLLFFSTVNAIFEKFGSNTLTKIKFSVRFHMRKKSFFSYI